MTKESILRVALKKALLDGSKKMFCACSRQAVDIKDGQPVCAFCKGVGRFGKRARPGRV